MAWTKDHVDRSLADIIRRAQRDTPRTSGSCFAAGTPVLLADGEWRPIESIAPGTAVQAFDEMRCRVVTARVSEQLVHEPEPLFRAVIEGVGRPLLVTANHPFYVAGRWQRIGELRLQSELFHFDAARGESATRRLLAFARTGARERVFNFEVADAHTYFVDGLLVHNGGVGLK